MIHNHIRIWRGDYYDGYLWYPADEDGLLLKINVDTGEVDYALTMLMPEPGLKHTYHQIVATGDGILWAIPGWGNRILRIDLKSGEQELIDFPDSDRQVNYYSKFTGCIKKGDKIFCFPGNMNYILEIDAITEEIQSHKSVVKESDNRQGRRMQNYFSWGTFREGEMVYAIGLLCNSFLEMNLVTKEYQLTALKNEKDAYGFDGVAIHGNKIYAVNKNGHVMVYDLQSKEFQAQLSGEKQYRFLCGCKEGVMLIPRSAEAYAFYHGETKEIKEIEYPKGHRLAEGMGHPLVRDVVTTEEFYFVTSLYCNMTAKICRKTGDILFLPLQMRDRKRLIELFSKNNSGIHREDVELFGNSCMDLESFLGLLTENSTTVG